MAKRKGSEKAAPNLKDLVDDEPPKSIDPYSTLSVDPDASDKDIKVAYRKAALKNHPDKVSPEDKAAATTRFQEIAFAYAILSDPRRRKRYDTTGSTAESLDIEDDDFDWSEFFAACYNEITTEDIENFASNYKGSSEERDAVLKAYTRAKGNLDKVFEHVMVSSVLDDEDRFTKMINEAIEKGEVESFKAFTEESTKKKERRRKRAEKEVKEAEELEQEISKKKEKKNKKENNGIKGEESLAALIQQRQKARGVAFLNNLEAKYANGSNGEARKRGSKRAATEHDEPPEEAFLAMAERVKRARGEK